MKRALPLPRRVRKRLFSSNSWIVAFTRDKSRKDPIMSSSYGDATVLRVDYEMEQNVEVLKLLTWAVAAGRVVSVVGTDEPVQPRSLAFQTWIYVMAKTFGCGVLRGGFLTTTATDEDLALNLTTSLQVVMGMYEVPLGATSDGKEWIGFTDMNEMRTLRGMAVSGEAHQPLPPELHQLRLRHALAGVLESRLLWPKAAKLTAADRLMWANHLKNGHIPYRRDCATCLQAAGTGRAHRRVDRPQPFTLALDVAGPLKSKGRSMGLVDENKLKYMLVGAYRIPKSLLTEGELPREEGGMDKLEKDDPLEAEEDDLADYVPSEPEDMFIPEEEFEPDLPLPLPIAEGEVKDPEDPIDKRIEELTTKVELATIYLMVPMRSRHTHDVLEAAQAMYNKLRKAHLPIMQIHSDRAREFRARSFRRWTIDKGVFHSRTSGSEPAANGTAECAVKFFKRRARQLLITSGAEARDWPLAAQHAAELHWRGMMLDTEEWHQMYKEAMYFVEKMVDWLRTKSKGVEEITDKDLEDLFDIDKREVIEAPPVMSRMVTEPEKLHPAEAYALKILTNISTEAVQPNQIHHLFNLLPDERFPRGEVPPGEVNENNSRSRAKEKKAWSTGAFIHGGVAGLRRSTRSFPTTTKVINAYIKQVDPNHQWTSVAILKNHQTAMHKDPHNSLYHQTLLAPLTKFRRGGLWGGKWMDMCYKYLEVQ
ncbi:GIP [Symbiodinium sp. CCMP2456]|nr:GIP [Symbiodinium sp. CCMP2456]